MAITRKWLKAMGIDEDKADEIIAAHTEITNRMQSEIDGLKESEPAEKPEAKDSEGETAKDGGNESVNEEIKALKQQIADMVKAAKDKEVLEAKTAAYKELLKGCGISNEKRLNAILKITDFDGVKLNKDGTIQNKDDLETGIKSDWDAFIETTKTKGAETATPPDGEEQKDKPNQAFVNRINQFRANLYGAQPETTEGG